MSNLWRFLVLFAFINFCCLASDDISSKYELKHFDESYVQNVSVSGSILVSFMVSGSNKTASPNALSIFTVPDIQYLNLQLTSIDGRYTAEGQLTIEVDKAGWLEINLPSKYHSILKKYEENEVVVFAFANGKDKRGRFVPIVFPTSWGKPTFERQFFILNSNGFAPNYIYNDDLEVTKQSFCHKMQNKVTRAFNYTCEFTDQKSSGKKAVTFSPSQDESGKRYEVWFSND